MDAQTEPEPEPEPDLELDPEIVLCVRGCGLPLSGAGEHCCVDALRAVTDALEGRSAALQHQARMERLRWNRREQNLLGQVSRLQNEAQLAALRYQRRLHQYLLHISSIAEQVMDYCKVRTCSTITSPNTHLQYHTLSNTFQYQSCTIIN